MLFLLDEVLAGTNSHDRRIGAEGIVRGLVEARRDWPGDDPRPRADRIAVDLGAAPPPTSTSRITFAGRRARTSTTGCAPGVVRTSNALALMRAVGLDV